MFGPINTAPDYLGGSDLRNYKSTIEALQKKNRSKLLSGL